MQAGDRHNGKAVSIQYRNGKSYVCKPRNALSELAFSGFVNALSELGMPYVPRCVNILLNDITEHTEEFIEQIPAMTQDDVVLYFRRCGVLLFLTYLLGSSDIHCENIIACCNSPVIVDSETLLSAKPYREITQKKQATLADSVLRTHLLPNWILSDNKMCDCSGFTGTLNAGKNILLLNGEPQQAYDNINHITDGFTQAYKFVCLKSDAVAKQLDLFSKCTVRQILRPTDVYNKIITFSNIFDDAEQKENAVRTMLARAYTSDSDKNRFEAARDIYEAEVQSVLNGDIPLFYTYGSSRDLYSGSQIVFKNFFTESPVKNAESRLGTLNTSDMNSQNKIIFQSLTAAKPIRFFHTIRKKEAGHTVEEKAFSLLESTAIESISSKWMLLGSGIGNSLFLQSCGMGLYNGLAGILCCYAALYCKTQNAKIADRLLELYNSYRSILFDSDFQIPLSDNACSFSDGIGGQLSALMHIYKLTGKTLFLQDATALVNRINADITSDLKPEIMSSALSLALTLPRIKCSASTALAEKLFDHFKNTDSTLTGTAHGAAGLALALSALQYMLNSSSADGNILRLLNSENTFYNAENCNWQDLRDQSKTGYMTGWCSGAPGIAMARKKLLSYTSNAEIRAICEADIAAATKKITNSNGAKRDSLCCGNAAILSAASALGIKNDSLYVSLKKRFMSDNLNLFHPVDTCDINSGLMQGLAGIGYTLTMYGDTRCGGMLI